MIELKRVFLSTFSCLVIFTFGKGRLAYGQHPADSTTVIQLKTINVSSLKLNLQLSSAVPVQRIDGVEAQRLNSLSVADALRYFSGVQLKDYGGVGGLKTINVRSLGTNHTSLFYNGIQIANAQSGQVDLGKFSLNNLEEISLYSGQNTAELLPAKAYSSASALYLKTRVPVFEEDKKSNQTIAFKTGAFGLINPSAALDFKLSKNMALRLDGEFTKAHGKYKYRYTDRLYDTTVVRQNGDMISHRVEAAVFHQLSAKQKIEVNLYHYQSERGLPGAIVSNKFEFSQRLWDKNFFVQGRYENTTWDKYKQAYIVKYTNDYTSYIDPDYKKKDGILDNLYHQNEYYFSSAHHYQFTNKYSVNFSADYYRQSLSANLYDFAYPHRNNLLFALAGAYHTNKFKVDASLLATYVNDQVKSNLPAGSKNAYTPTLMLNWHPLPTKAFSIRSFYKSVFRLPTFNDLYYTFIGNTRLNPEYAKQLNFGISYQLNRKSNFLNSLTVNSDIYTNKVTDKIVAIPTLNLFRWTMVNLDEVHIKGFTFDAASTSQWRPIQVQTKLNYTYEQALDVTPNGTAYRHQIPYIPEHSGSFRINADYQTWGLNYGFVYTGDRYSQKANIPENYVPAWYTHDLAVQKILDTKNYRYKLGLEVNNLLNQYYDVILNYPMPGRNVRVSLQLNFK